MFDVIEETELGFTPTEPSSLEHTFSASIPERIREITSYTDAKTVLQVHMDSPHYSALPDARVRWRCFCCTDDGIAVNYAKAQSDMVEHLMTSHGVSEHDAMAGRFGI